MEDAEIAGTIIGVFFIIIVIVIIIFMMADHINDDDITDIKGEDKKDEIIHKKEVNGKLEIDDAAKKIFEDNGKVLKGAKLLRKKLSRVNGLIKKLEQLYDHFIYAMHNMEQFGGMMAKVYNANDNVKYYKSNHGFIDGIMMKITLIVNKISTNGIVKNNLKDYSKAFELITNQVRDYMGKINENLDNINQLITSINNNVMLSRLMKNDMPLLREISNLHVQVYKNWHDY